MSQPVEERVKPCLQCATILPFDAEICSLCGASTRAVANKEEPEPIKPCMACEALIPESALFCPDCGDFTLSVAVPEASAVEPVKGGFSPVAALSRVVAFLVLGSALVLFAAVVIDFIRTQGYDL